MDEEVWAAGETDLNEQSEAVSDSEDQLRNVNDSPDGTTGRSLPSKPVENASLQETLTKLIEDMVVQTIVLAMERAAAGLRMSIRSAVADQGVALDKYQVCKVDILT